MDSNCRLTSSDYSNFLKLNLLERVITVDILLTYDLFKVYKINFNYYFCYTEVIDMSKNVLLVIEKHYDFFNSVYCDISQIINDKKKYNTNFRLMYGDLDTCIYFNIIIKSIHFIDNFNHSDDIIENEHMLHRNVVMGNINKYSLTFMLLNKKFPIQNNCVKLIMVLHCYVTYKKIKLRVKNKFKTDVYLKFKIIVPHSLSERIILTFSRNEFSKINEYMVGSSYLTLTKTIKKCNWQAVKNTISDGAILSLSKIPIYIDLTF